MNTSPPLYLTPRPDGIPKPLRAISQWTNWSPELLDGRWTKVLKSSATRSNASSTDNRTWSAFETALEANPDRLGFVFKAGGGLFGIDLDDCRDPETGGVEPWAEAIVERFPRIYWEVSPSGSGLHGIGLGQLPEGRRRVGKIEMYDRGRYFTVTGHPLPGHEELGCVDLLDLAAWHTELFPPKQTSQGTPQASGGASVDDQELIERIRRSAQGETFQALFDRGDVTPYAGDDSAGDLALMNLLRFWTGGDPARMEAIFGRSKLAQRDKWQNRPDYRKRTIDRSLDGGEVYSPGPKLRSGGAQSDTSAPSAVHALPEFPVGIFPEPIDEWITRGAKAAGVPVEMVAFPFLTYTGGMLGNRIRILLKEGFTQLPAIWVAIVTDPGRGKSPALAHARRIFSHLQSLAFDEYQVALLRFEEEEQAWKAADADVRGPKPLRPKLRHYFSNNATLEAVVGILSHSPGLTLGFDELSSFFGGMNQYKAGKGADRSEYLSAWSNSPIKKDRGGADVVMARDVCLGVTGGLTTDNLGVLHSKDGSRDGMLERFSIIRADFDPPEWSDDDVPPHVFVPALEVIQNLDRLPPKSDDAGGIVVRLSSEAKAEYVSWFNENAQLQRQVTGVAAGFYSKLTQQIARFALILHALKNSGDPRVMVSGETMTDAITLGEFVRAHFQACLPLLREAAVVQVGGVESRILRILRTPENHEDGEYISRRSISKKLGNVQADNITAALSRLEEVGRVEKRITKTVTKPREEWRMVTAEVVDFPQRSHEPLRATGTDGIDLQPGEEAF